MMSPVHTPDQWSNVIFAAEAAREPFEDATIITAQNHFLETVLQSAAEIVLLAGHALTETKVHDVAHTLVSTDKVAVREHVRVDDTGISVCIDVDAADDEDTMWIALDYVAKALDQLQGAQGTVFFGEDLRFPTITFPTQSSVAH